MNELIRGAGGEDVRFDYSAIEKSLAEMWRSETQGEEQAVTRAALWNVVAHTWQARHHSMASEVLSHAAAAVPQRTIVIRAEPEAAPEMNAWISANCHRIGGEKQVCSEEVAIAASGALIHRIPPLVNALLIPDMPVAVWWVGDLPNDHQSYVENLLDPADRLIVDSSHFDAVGDLECVLRIGEQTITAPADLNWVRLEEWRVAAATIFDPPSVRARLQRIRRLRLVAASSGNAFGDATESLLFAAWLSVQAGHVIHSDGRVESTAGIVEYDFRTEQTAQDKGSLIRAELEFADGSSATIVRDDQQQVLVTTVDGMKQTIECVTRFRARRMEDLIVRQLKRPEADRLYIRALPMAAKLARRVAA